MGHHVLTDRAIMGRYYNRLEQGPYSWIGDIAVDIDSNQDKENHVWLGMPPQMREWVGGKGAKTFRDFNYEITNKDFESTIEYHERDLAEDKTGQLQIRINEHADRVLSHPASLLSSLILNAESTACYDGQYFFDTDHSEGDSGTQDNDKTYGVAVAATPTAAEMEGAILQAIQTMYGFKDDVGEPLNETAKKFMVMVPVPFWASAQKAVSANVIVMAPALGRTCWPI